MDVVFGSSFWVCNINRKHLHLSMYRSYVMRKCNKPTLWQGGLVQHTIHTFWVTALLGTDYKLALCAMGGFLVSYFIRVIVLILFPVTCIEHVRTQFLSRFHSIITSRWLKLVTSCFLLVKLQLKIFRTSPWSSLCANVNNPVHKVWNVLISLTFSPAHFCTRLLYEHVCCELHKNIGIYLGGNQSHPHVLPPPLREQCHP